MSVGDTSALKHHNETHAQQTSISANADGPRDAASSKIDHSALHTDYTDVETMRLSCTVFELYRVICRKWPILTYLTCVCRPQGDDLARVSSKSFFGVKKTRVPGIPCVIVCVILSLAVLIQYRSVTDTQTDKTHNDSILYTRPTIFFPVTPLGRPLSLHSPLPLLQKMEVL